MKINCFKSIVSLALVLVMLFSFSAYFGVSAATTKIGTATTTLKIRKTPTAVPEDNIYKDSDGKNLCLYKGDEVVILDTVASNGDKNNPTWHYIEFKYNGQTLKGYVSAEYITVRTIPDDDTPVDLPEGVPEIYKEYIEDLLRLHPNWKFEFYDTGYEWNDLFKTGNWQGEPGRSLIYKSYPLSYRSTTSGNYDWRKDQWIAHDANSWYQANTETIAYYMDPRNFLTEKNVFMFEKLSYDKTTHTLEGIKNIIKGSFMDGKTIKNLNGKNVSYQQAYVDAAVYANVSPFHLASRTIQEVGKNGSGSTSGKYSGYEGYYNYYNIGASAASNPIANGLNFAKTGGTMSDANKEKCYIPWNTPYRSIVGGGYWIGMSYINSRHHQDTLYFQKFNTSNPDSSLMWHQYMGNIMAPASEAPRIKNSYNDLGVLDNGFTFRIPVYKNMPKEPCKLPASNNYNPNNWLKALTVGSYNINFDGGTTSYNLTVPATVNSVKITATAVNSNATVKGAGNVALKDGKNVFSIVVTAENGNKRTYTVNVTRTTEGSIPLKGISLSKTTASMYVGDSTTLTVTYNPNTTTDNKTVTWSTSDSKVASVDKNGKITAVGKGTATITAKVGSFTATCKVTVSANDNYALGDVDADGDITIADALMIFKYKSGEAKLSSTALKAADTDKNGNVELADALRIFKYKSGEISKL